MFDITRGYLHLMMKSPIVLLLELPWLVEKTRVFVGKNSNSELLHAGEILFFSPTFAP